MLVISIGIRTPVKAEVTRHIAFNNIFKEQNNGDCIGRFSLTVKCSEEQK